MNCAVVSSAVLVSIASLVCACGSDTPDETASTRGTRNSNVRSSAPANESDQGGVDVFDAAAPTRRDPSSERADAGSNQNGTRSGSSRTDAGATSARDSGTRASTRSQSMSKSAAELDAAPQQRVDAPGGRDAGTRGDAGSEPSRTDATGPEDAGLAQPDADTAPNSGSCCSVSDRPGCGDSELRACVCAREPSCCSDAWTEACTRVVTEKFCQSGVRDCVCGNAEGQWRQPACCESSWDDTCESVATNKCGATSECK